jgi:hypothetical protein
MLNNIPELSWGAFVPQFLGFFNNAKDRDLKWFTDLDRAAFFHEAVHYINALSSTYSIHLILECLDAVKKMIREFGGNANGIFSLISTEDDYWKHFLQQSESCEGRYSYENLNIKEYLTDRGYFREDADRLLLDLEPLKQTYIAIYNEQTQCHEILCWNHVSQQYFVIPMGIMAMQECQAYINEMIHATESDEFASFTLNSKKYSSENPVHIYTILFELFHKAIIESEEIAGTKEQKLLFLEFALDISMQMPLFVDDENYKDTYIPSSTFIKILDYISQKKCVPDLKNNRDYIGYLDEMCRAIDIYPCTKSWRNLFDVIDTMLNFTNDDLKKHVSSEFLSGYSNKVAETILNIANRNPVNKHYKHGIATNDTKDKVKGDVLDYIDKNRSVMVNGSLGGGILFLVRDVLKMRISNPWYFTYPHNHFHKYFDDILPPIVFFNNAPVSYLSTQKYWLLRDMQFIKHLWALYIQKQTSSESFKCGNRFFEISCKERQTGCCFEYRPDAPLCNTNCEFTDCLSWFKLISR